VVVALAGCGEGVLSVALPNASGAQMVYCARLVDQLPNRLDAGGHRSLSPRLVQPRSPLLHAWGHVPVVLRCGVPKPAGYQSDSAQTTDVNGVLWFQQLDGDTVIWTAIRRNTNVELRVPTSYQGQGAFLVDLGPAIQAAIP
jgi:hypothetical protein